MFIILQKILKIEQLNALNKDYKLNGLLLFFKPISKYLIKPYILNG